jgi:hypothetical protein
LLDERERRLARPGRTSAINQRSLSDRPSLAVVQLHPPPPVGRPNRPCTDDALAPLPPSSLDVVDVDEPVSFAVDASLDMPASASAVPPSDASKQSPFSQI